MLERTTLEITPHRIVDSFVNLAREVEDNSDSQVMVSELITRFDESFSGDVAEVNKRLLKFCKQQDWTVIRHNNIHQSDLNKGRLPLNERGTSRMFNNFVDKLGGDFY